MIQINGRNVSGEVNLFVRGEIEIKICNDGRHINLTENEEGSCDCATPTKPKMNVAFSKNENLDGVVMLTIDNGTLWLSKEDEQKIYK